MKIRGNTVGTTMKPEKVVEKAGGGGGGSTVIVTLVGLGKASHTSLQIAELLKNGHNVLFCNGTYYSLDVARDSVARFSAVSDDGSVDLYEINNAGEVEYFFLELTGGGSVDLSNYYTKEEIDQAAEGLLYGMASENYVNETIDLRIGDISTALTDLHNYAEALKGGEAV